MIPITSWTSFKPYSEVNRKLLSILKKLNLSSVSIGGDGGYWRRVGDCMEIAVLAANSHDLKIPLPIGYEVDYSKVSPNFTLKGTGQRHLQVPILGWSSTKS